MSNIPTTVDQAALSASDHRPRHVCHCGKQFIRKEHLRRHEATHSEGSHVCPKCQRAFARTDVLKRHVNVCGNSTGPSGSMKTRACEACRSNKTKCDGGPTCSLCAKRGVGCIFSPPKTRRGNNNGAGPGEKEKNVSANDPILNNNPATGGPPEDEEMDDAPISQSSSDKRQWGSALPPCPLMNAGMSDSTKEYMLSCYECYLALFHHRWRIIHAATFRFEEQHCKVMGSVVMIGAWLRNQDNDRQYAQIVHHQLVEDFIELLSKEMSSRETKEQLWSSSTHQGMLLNIIFAIYHGGEQVLSRANVLRSLLITTLRDIQYFDEAEATHQQEIHFPGTWKPYIATWWDRRKEFISCLFRVDTYMSLIFDQPPQIFPEELDARPVPSYSSRNAYGVHVLIKRWNLEVTRGGEHLIMAANLEDPLLMNSYKVIAEDVQLGLSAGLAGTWKLRIKQARFATGAIRSKSSDQAENDPRVETILREVRMKGLYPWKGFVVTMEGSCGMVPQGPGPNEQFISWYRGDDEEEEDGATVDWQPAALERASTLVSEAAVSTHLLQMLLCCEYRVIKTNFLATRGSNSQTGLEASNGRLQEWANGSTGRRALWHAVTVLCVREALIEMQGDDSAAADPIVNVAVAHAVLVVWAWINHVSTPRAHASGYGVADSTVSLRPSDLGLHESSEVQGWISNGGIIASADSVPFCMGALELWLRRFATALPGGGKDWEAARLIAPILRYETAKT